MLGPTATLSDPATQSTTGARNLNDRGYIDIGITAPAGKNLDVDSVLDFGALIADEITLTGPGSAGVALDRLQAPLFLRRQGNTWFFRFWTRGSYASGQLTAAYVAGTFGFVEGGTNTSTATTTPVDFIVGGIATPNLSYVDITLAPTAATELNLPTILDALPEFSFGNTGAGTAAPLAAAAPTRLASGAWRYYLTGDFVAGQVDVMFAAGSFTAGTDPGETTDDLGNLGATATFTVGTLTASLGDPVGGAVLGTDVLNQRGYFEVTFTKPLYATTLDVASVTDLAPEITITTEGAAIDDTRAPVLLATDPVAGTWRFRYFYNGPRNAAIDYQFIGGSVEFTNASGERVPLFAQRSVTVAGSTGALYIDVPFGEFPNLDGVVADDITVKNAAGVTLTLGAPVESDAVAGLFRFAIIDDAGTEDDDVLSGEEVVVDYTGAFDFGGIQRVVLTTGSATPSATGTFIEVRVARIGETALDPTSFSAADIVLGGDGLNGVTVDSSKTPELLVRRRDRPLLPRTAASPRARSASTGPRAPGSTRRATRASPAATRSSSSRPSSRRPGRATASSSSTSRAASSCGSPTSSTRTSSRSAARSRSRSATSRSTAPRSSASSSRPAARSRSSSSATSRPARRPSSCRRAPGCSTSSSGASPRSRRT